MFKKFSYLASVSILASVVMAQAGQAMDEEPIVKAAVLSGYKNYQGVLSAMEEHFRPKHLPSAPKEEPSTGGWILKSVTNVASTCIGHPLRWVGGISREESPVGNLLVNQATKMAVNYDERVGTVTNIVQEAGTSSQFRCTTTNFVRGAVATCLTGQTETLERVLRLYWIDRDFTLEKVHTLPSWITQSKEALEPEHAFTETACALFLAPLTWIRDGDHLRTAYRSFITSWNHSSYTAHSDDAGTNLNYFVNGIIKGLVLANQPMNENFLTYMEGLGVDFAIHPSTKKITSASVVEDYKNRGEKLEADQVPTALEKARKTTFLEHAKAVYTKLNAANQGNQYRLQAIANGPLVQPIVPAVAAKGDPAPETNELGQSLLMGPEPKNSQVVQAEADKAGQNPDLTITAENRDMNQVD